LALIAIRPITLAIPGAVLAGGRRPRLYHRVLFFVNERLRYSHFIWHLFVSD
jgi:hypothetical protein